MGGMSWVALSFHWVDSNHIPFPLPLSSGHFLELVGWCGCSTQHRETLLVERRKEICEDLLCNPCLRTWIGCLADGHRPIFALWTRWEFLCTRARIFFLLAVFHFLSFVSSSLPETTFTTTSFLCERGYFSTSADWDDLLVVNVVLYPLHVQNTSVLSSSYLSSRVLIPRYRMS